MLLFRNIQAITSGHSATVFTRFCSANELGEVTPGIIFHLLIIKLYKPFMNTVKLIYNVCKRCLGLRSYETSHQLNTFYLDCSENLYSERTLTKTDKIFKNIFFLVYHSCKQSLSLQ